MEKRNKEGTIPGMPECERPYERIEKNGAHVLSDAELLAVIITTGTKNRTAVDISRSVLSLCKNGDISYLKDVSREELRSINGVGRVKALQLTALCELSQRLSKRHRQRLSCKNAESLGEMLADDMSCLNQEVFRTVVLDRKMKMIEMKDVFVGTVDMAPVHPREVFSEAIRHLGSYVVLAHNHPSGDVKPSREDLNATRRLMLAGMVLEIEVLDHIIVGNGRFYSMHANGDIEKIKKSLDSENSGRS